VEGHSQEGSIRLDKVPSGSGSSGEEGGGVSEERHEKTAGEEATDAFKTLLARIGEVFGVFDLSFFVAGAVCAGAVVFGLHIFGSTWPRGIDLGKWSAVHVVATVLGCYVLGIVCFAASRHVRNGPGFYLQLPEQLGDFNLAAHYDLADVVPPLPSLQARLLALRPGAPVTERDVLAQKCTRVYTLLWAEVRQDKALAPSFNLVMRYWVMAAMCDGLATALLVWLVLWVLWAAHVDTVPSPPSGRIMLLVGVALGVGTVLFFREARRYTRYQMYEIVATLAYRRDARAAGGETSAAKGGSPA
jgi:hypothetical protein